MKYTVLKKNNRNAIKSVKITSNCKKKGKLSTVMVFYPSK